MLELTQVQSWIPIDLETLILNVWVWRMVPVETRWISECLLKQEEIFWPWSGRQPVTYSILMQHLWTSENLKPIIETLSWWKVWRTNSPKNHPKKKKLTHPLIPDPPKKKTTLFLNIHPRKLTWNLKISTWKRRNIYKPPIFGFHVSFRGCITKDTPSPIHPQLVPKLSPASGSWTLEDFKAKRIWPSCGWGHFSKQTGGWKTENFGNRVYIYIYLQIRMIYIYNIILPISDFCIVVGCWIFWRIP